MKILYKFMWIPDSARDSYDKRWRTYEGFPAEKRPTKKTVYEDEDVRLYLRSEFIKPKKIQCRVRPGRLYD